MSRSYIPTRLHRRLGVWPRGVAVSVQQNAVHRVAVSAHAIAPITRVAPRPPPEALTAPRRAPRPPLMERYAVGRYPLPCNRARHQQHQWHPLWAAVPPTERYQAPGPFWPCVACGRRLSWARRDERTRGDDTMDATLMRLRTKARTRGRVQRWTAAVVSWATTLVTDRPALYPVAI